MANAIEINLRLSSPAFKNEGIIPEKYTCDGGHISPPLHIEHIPEGTQSLAIIMEDPDAPKGTFDHWLVWNIPVTNDIDEDTMPGISGKNSAGNTGYHAPCPPTGYHRYYIYLFALDALLDLPVGTNKKTLQQAMSAHIIAMDSLMGRYRQVLEKSASL
jgi:Raf kinase inhibitor-like YbhB/YbcL family protein